MYEAMASGAELQSFHALLKAGYFDGVGAFFTFFDFEFHPVAILNFVDETGLMDENFFLIIVGDDEAEAFGVVVKLNGTGEHSGEGDDNGAPLLLPGADRRVEPA
ncbi:hypothetical protein ABIB44_003059 [Hymenobacter sp. UYCo722]